MVLKSHPFESREIKLLLLFGTSFLGLGYFDRLASADHSISNLDSLDSLDSLYSGGCNDLPDQPRRANVSSGPDGFLAMGHWRLPSAECRLPIGMAKWVQRVTSVFDIMTTSSGLGPGVCRDAFGAAFSTLFLKWPEFNETSS